MNAPPQRQIIANRNILPWKPSASSAVNDGMNFVTTNENIHNSDMQNDKPKSLTRSGITSEMTRMIMVSRAKFAMRITNEYERSGIQLYASTE